MRAPYASDRPRADQHHRCSPYDVTYSSSGARCSACGRRWALVTVSGRLQYRVVDEGGAR